MKKSVKISIVSISAILLVGIIVLAIINYIVLPPKVSENAQKYKYNYNNMLKLKSITIDRNRIIYEFSSLNRYFNKNFVKKNQKKYGSNVGPFLELFKLDEIENNYNNVGSSIYSNDFEIVSTITSNYLIIFVDEKNWPDAVYCHYDIEKNYGNPNNDHSSYLSINLVNMYGYENFAIGKKNDYYSQDISISKSQQYNYQKKRWSKINKKSFPYSEYR